MRGVVASVDAKMNFQWQRFLLDLTANHSKIGMISSIMKQIYQIKGNL